MALVIINRDKALLMTNYHLGLFVHYFYFSIHRPPATRLFILCDWSCVAADSVKGTQDSTKKNCVMRIVCTVGYIALY